MPLFTIPALLDQAAADHADKVALTDGDRAVTFAELRAAAGATAAALRRLGLGRGDRIGICTSKSIDQGIAILAVLEAGAVFVPILPRLKRDNIAHIGTDSGMRLVAVDESRAGEVHEALPDARLLDVADLVATATADRDAAPPPRSIGVDTAAIIYSSGSTGRPKGIVLSHRNLADGARLCAEYLGTGPDDHIAGILSLNFDYGLNQLWQCLLTGATLHLHEFLFPADLFQFLARRSITALPVMPVLITRMFDPRLLRRRPEVDLSSVRYISTSGGPVSSHMLTELRRTFPAAEIVLMYGLTEAFRSTYLPPEQLAARPTSIGRAIPDVEILVVDDDLDEVPAGVPGELVHRGGCVAKGYWNAPEETARRFRRIDRFPGETVVFSGDIVTRDEEGYLYFVGRRDAMIKTMGFRVSPSEVEETALRFEGIEACVAFGVANVEVGQDIALAYTVRASVSPPLLRQYLKDNLPSHMVPRYLLEDEAFPATGNAGKIDRQTVVARALERIAREA